VTLDIWCLRHAETDWTAAGRFCGWSDPPLNERGRMQARALQEVLHPLEFDSVVSSPSIRAVETARLAYAEPRPDHRLRELDFGDLDGSTWTECSPEMRERLIDFDAFAAPHGEAVPQLAERVLAALADLGPGRHLVVTHGGVIRLLLRRAGITAYPPPAGLSRVRIEPGSEWKYVMEIVPGKKSNSSRRIAACRTLGGTW
jgi:2,3-bisphosphoglycerate-dependent phosphoglycerate mutase